MRDNVDRMKRNHPEIANDLNPYVTIYVETRLFEDISNMVAANNAGGNYEFASASAFIRSAIEEYVVSGIPLTANTRPGRKKRFSLTFSRDLRAAFDTLPRGKKTEVIDRAIRSKLDRMR